VKIAILHGPNLDRLGKREPEIYGHATLKDLEKLVRAEARKLGFSTVFFQSAHEGALVDKIHALTDRGIDAFIVNFGAYSHTSIALHDAIKGAGVTLIELHISNVHAREEFRHKSWISPVAKAVMAGFGINGYSLAIAGLVQLTEKK